MQIRLYVRGLTLAFLIAAARLATAAMIDAPDDASSPGAVIYTDQGSQWTRQTRAAYYNVDQGSRLIPYRWLAALKAPDGRPFLRNELGRYGFLPRDTGERGPFGLPIGFTVALDDGEVQTGINCAACHTRQMTAGGKSYRIDGGPAIVDFENFFTDLDAAVRHTLADPRAFAAFKRAVERGRSPRRTGLLEDLLAWYVPYHALIGGSLPQRNMWGLGRVDAISIIFNRLTGIDIGERPGHLIPQNIHPADAPVRFPFLWNATIQDFTQWAGITPNGNQTQGLSRNLGEVYGVFAMFHPKKDASQPLGYDYLSDNSANWSGLTTLEDLVDAMGPPKWPWSVNAALAQAGSKVYAAECASCHGIQPGLPRPPVTDTWATPVQNVGTDTREWRVVLRLARTGVMEGATLPGGSVPLGPVDLAALILTTATQGAMTQKYPGIVMAPQAPLKPNSYESRVLQGIWAAPPYLHNGSVPSMADLLKTARDRPTSFEVGPAYDPDTLGLAQRQPQGRRNLRVLDDCRNLDSGNSNCGHEFGTRLPDDAKKALLEYIKTL